MRAPITLTAALLLAALATPAFAGSPFAVVPAGTPVRVTAAGSPASLRGRLLSAGDDSLRFQPADGGPALALANGAVRFLDYLSSRQPCERMNALLGIGAGMVGGAVLGVALIGGGHDAGRGTTTSAPGGGGGDRLADAAGAATATPTPTTPTPSAAYRAVMGTVLGGVVGGIAGGVLGNAVGFGFKEDVWTSVPGPVSRALGVPSSPAPGVFTVRVSFRFPRAAS
jgi:hypothetical protein